MLYMDSQASPVRLSSNGHRGSWLDSTPSIACLPFLVSLAHTLVAVAWAHFPNELLELESLSQDLLLGDLQLRLFQCLIIKC